VATINTTTPSFSLTTTISATSGPVDECQWFYSTNSSTGFIYLANEIPVSGTFGAGATVGDIISIPQEGTFFFKARTGRSGRYSDYSPSTDTGFVWNPNNYGGI
jgi:hypothetical protein